MQKFITILSVLIITAFIAGCGGGSSTTAANTTTYDTPPTTAPSNTHMGGAVQGGAIKAKFSNYSVSTFAGSVGTAGFTNNSTTTLPTTAKFNHPVGITTDGTNLYVADYNNSAIRRIDLTSKKVTTLTDLKDTNGVLVTLNHPSDITTDGINLYVVDSANNVIRIFDKDKKIVTTIGSTTGLAGAVDSKVPTEVRFNQPTGITTDGENLYVTDSHNHTIRRIVISSNAVTTLAGAPGAAGFAEGALSTDRTKSDARFNLPARITTDRENLYVTDFNNKTIRKIVIKTGAVTTIAGSAGIIGSTVSAATGATARFNQPNGITTDGTNLYVTDSFNNTISKIVISNETTFSGPVTMIAGTVGIAGSVNTVDATPVKVVSFDTPIGITTDGTSLFVADSQNNTIRQIR